MLQDPKELHSLIKATLKRNNHNKDFYKRYINTLETKIYANKLYSVFYFHYPVESLDVSDLYHLADFLSKEVKDSKLIPSKMNPELWFSDNEIKVAKNRLVDNKANQKESVWRVKDILSKGESEWATVVTYKELAELYNKALLVYNPDTQRDPIVEYKWGERLVSPRLFISSVREIEQLMLDGDFESNTLTFNILKTGGEVVIWDKIENMFEFQRTKDSEMAIIDGFHRLSAILSIMSNHPDFVGYMTINIKNLTVTRAQNFIYQEQKRNNISEHLLKQYDQSDKYMQYTKLINEYGNSESSELYNMMASDIKDVGVTKYVLLNKFAEPLEEYFKDVFEECGSARERERVISYIVRFFNEVIGLKIVYYKNIESTYKNTILLTDNIWSVFLRIARELYQDENWRDKVEKVITSQDWDKANPKWRKLRIIFANYTKTSKDKTYEYFMNVINNETTTKRW